ncbi:MAG TPA: four-carbon acid sugar kinase family protein [Anaerolineales bacterium]|nr:four-carbon acid sugar kinase family protein [Anaerolineales bacterium]
MRMGVVADDVTGSNDIGIMFAKSGYLTHVYSFEDAASFAISTADLSAPDISILDTNSRLDAPEVAYDKVFAATRALQQAGCRQFYKKTCSVFRGNIGAEFDAMLDALGLEFAIVVLGFPKNGRTTVDGIHYVHGKKLEESEFRRDPIHPMTRSDLAGILQSQTKRKVGLVTHTVVERGVITLRDEIKRRRAECQYLILDVTGPSSLATIAQAVHDEPVLCGSSAIAEELPAVWGPPTVREHNQHLPPLKDLGVLIVAGSLMPQTGAQIEHLKQNRTACFVMDTACLFNSERRESHITSLSKAISTGLRIGNDTILHSPNDPEALESARRTGLAHSLSRTDVSRLVSGALAEVTARVLTDTGQNRLIVAGGETSAAVCARLGVNGMRVWKEIQPGLPSCLSLNDPPRILVLKSGSFGKPDFFDRAREHLKES